MPRQSREPAGGSSSRATSGSRSAKSALAGEHGAGTHGIVPPSLGPGGRSISGTWEWGQMPGSARKPAGGSSRRSRSGSRGARKGQGIQWRDAVAEVVLSEITRSLVTMLRGSTPRPAKCRGRVRRSSRRRQRDDSSSASTTDVSRSGDESAVAAFRGVFRAPPTPSTVRHGTQGIDPRAQPTIGLEGGERGEGGRESRPGVLNRGSPRESPSQPVRRRRGGRPTRPRRHRLGWCRRRFW